MSMTFWRGDATVDKLNRDRVDASCDRVDNGGLWLKARKF